jgi:hypothetical protein
MYVDTNTPGVNTLAMCGALARRPRSAGTASALEHSIARAFGSSAGGMGYQIEDAGACRPCTLVSTEKFRFLRGRQMIAPFSCPLSAFPSKPRLTDYDTFVQYLIGASIVASGHHPWRDNGQPTLCRSPMNAMSETFDLAYGDPRSRLVEELRRQVGACEGAAPQDEITFSAGTPALDQLLGAVSKPSPPERGRHKKPSPSGRGQVAGDSPWRGEGALRYGMLIEWLSGLAHSGAATLSLLCAREACRPGGALVVIDRLQTFYPPTAAAWGIDLNRLLIVRPRGMRDALWATLQALRSPAVAAVWAPLEKLDSREFRQLQLAAQAGHTLGLLLRPAHVRGQPSWADVRLKVGTGGWGLGTGEPASAGGESRSTTTKLQIANWQGTQETISSAMNNLQFRAPPEGRSCNLQSPLTRFIHVRILRQRGARPGRSLLLEINDATHTIQASSQPNLRPQPLAPNPQPHAPLPLFVASELADPAPRSLPARA